jgi:hypothetical protein
MQVAALAKVLKTFRKEPIVMKKLLIAGLVVAMSLSAGAAFAAGKAKAPKKEAPKKIECSVGDKKVMTATTDACMKMGGLVMNFPGPAKDAPKAAKAKKK